MKALPYYGAEPIPRMRWRDTPYRWWGDLQVDNSPLKHTRAWREYREYVGWQAYPPEWYEPYGLIDWVFGPIDFAIRWLAYQKHAFVLHMLDRK